MRKNICYILIILRRRTFSFWPEKKSAKGEIRTVHQKRKVALNAQLKKKAWTGEELRLDTQKRMRQELRFHWKRKENMKREK